MLRTIRLRALGRAVLLLAPPAAVAAAAPGCDDGVRWSAAGTDRGGAAMAPAPEDRRPRDETGE